MCRDPASVVRSYVLEDLVGWDRPFGMTGHRGCDGYDILVQPAFEIDLGHAERLQPSGNYVAL